MKAGVLFSGGKDSMYAAFLAKENNIDLTCLISLLSENKESYMFHTPSISKVEYQAKVMNIQLIKQNTQGEKEKELKDLKNAIKKAIDDFSIECVITGAVESAYQTSRVQSICDMLNLDCFNPLWQKDQFEILHEIYLNNFDVIITGIFCYPLDRTWLGRKIDRDFINDVTELHRSYQINPAGEGGEFETFVIDCPLFGKPLELVDKSIYGSKNSWRMEVKVK